MIFKNRNGQVSFEIVIMTLVTMTIVAGLAVWSAASLQNSFRTLNRTDAFSIAEAGIEYYRWHLAHAPQDFQDGSGQPGPYTHPYYDKDGNRAGTFVLDITPPATGSTVVKIRSTGTIIADPSVKKIIEVRMAIPSIAKYAVAENANVRFGQGTEVFGPIHSNGGVHFDGLAHNLVSSALSQYSDPDYPASQNFGVYTKVSPADPSPPAAAPSRPDVFAAGRSFPVPAIDFSGISQSLAQIKTDAQTAGFYATSSGVFGYEIVLNPNGTFNLYKVTGLAQPPQGCSNSAGQTGWGTWTIQNESPVGTYSNPANGQIFVEDNLWVRGQINGARLTIASGRFPDNPASRTSITVNSDLKYSSYNGADVLGLIAQQDFNVGLGSPDNLRIDGAIIAQNGRAGRYYYGSSCGSGYTRNSLTLYGMLATNGRYGFAYTDNTGYQTRNLIYDSNLLYGPPPATPLTGAQYTILSWDEVQ